MASCSDWDYEVVDSCSCSLTSWGAGQHRHRCPRSSVAVHASVLSSLSSPCAFDVCVLYAHDAACHTQIRNQCPSRWMFLGGRVWIFCERIPLVTIASQALWVKVARYWRWKPLFADADSPSNLCFVCHIHAVADPDNYVEGTCFLAVSRVPLGLVRGGVCSLNTRDWHVVFLGGPGSRSGAPYPCHPDAGGTSVVVRRSDFFACCAPYHSRLVPLPVFPSLFPSLYRCISLCAGPLLRPSVDYPPYCCDPAHTS